MLENPSKIVNKYDEVAQKLQNLSRYKDLSRLVNENGDSYIETPNKVTIKESNKDSFYTVEPGLEGRMDLISNKFYGTPFLWWVIAEVNHISNPMKVEAGVILRIPYMSNLYSIGGVVS